MKKRVVSFLLAVLMTVTLLPVAVSAAVTSTDGVTFTVRASKEAGLDGDVRVSFTKSNKSYSGTLYLPGGADTTKLALSWDAGVTVAGYNSGEAPVPANGESMTYTVSAGGSTAGFTVKTVQGSTGVKGLFLDIDESKGTIAAMNGDPDHETECFGSAAFGGETNYISMKGRGNTTWDDFDKKPYNITFFKTNDYSGDKKKVELIDGTKTKKWSLLANAKDPTGLRNKIGYDIADVLGIGLPSESIDVWMNGKYQGNYLLTPKNDYQAPDDGYMVEIDNLKDVDQFTLSGSLKFTVKEMADGLTVDDVKGSVSKAWDALQQTGSDEYLKYIDLDSWAKLYLLNELYKDIDVSGGSIFFTKATMEDGDKLTAGPVWDLDGTMGRVSTTYVYMDHTHENDAGGWYIDSIKGTDFLQQLGKHASFMRRVYEIYNEYKTAMDGILADLDTQNALIADSAEMNYARWPQYTVNTESFTIAKDNTKYGSGAYAVTYQKTDSRAAFTNNLKEYVIRRLAFLADNLTVAAPAGSITGNTSVVVDELLSLTADCTAGSYQWQSSADGKTWTDISGATAKTYSVPATMAMNGLAIRCAAKNTGTAVIDTTRVAKAAPAAVTLLSPVTLTVTRSGFYIAKDPKAGLDGDVAIALTGSGNTYSGTLYLPGSADTGALRLCWNGIASVSVGGTPYASGKAPVPAVGKSLTYAADGKTYTVTTVQGSAGVRGLFLDIDESKGTIAAMNGDPDHETECFGSVSYGGETNYISMKGRGNSTWSGFDKKPYNITFFKTNDYSGDKKKVELIKGTKTKKWSLLANAKDPTGLRNKIGYDIADALGIGLPSESVDVWMNGDYLGNYLLTPKNDYQAPDDGYMVEIDNKTDDDQFTLTNSPKFTVKERADSLTVDDVKASVSKAWDALRQTGSEAYLDYFDLDSWAKMYLLNELYKDEDVDDGSIFFTKATMEDGDKLVAGPVWDLDITLGRVSRANVNVDRTTENTGGGWYIDGINTSPIPIFQLLGKHASFMRRVYEIYNEYKGAMDAIPADLDAQSTLIAASGDMNLARWPQYATNMKHYSVAADHTKYGSGAYAVTYQKTDSWAAYTANLNEYVIRRLAFLADNLTVTAPAGSITGTTTLAVGDVLSLTADCTAGSYQWQSSADGKTWTDISGATAKTYSVPATMAMNGLAIRCAAKNTGTAVIDTTRVAKAAPAAVTVLSPVTLTVTAEGHVHHYQTAVTEPTCTEKGYTTYTCSCGDSYTGDYTDAKGHDFKDGQCTRCPEKDPAYIPQCIVRKNVSLTADQLIFTLGGTELGEYTFAKSGSGWSIRASSGKYLGFAGNAFTYADTPFAWNYSGNSFTTSVTTSGGNSGWGILGWLFGGNRTTTTTYYLVYTGGKFAVSTGSSGGNAAFAVLVKNMTHTFGAWTAAAGDKHTRTCTVCGLTTDAPCVYDQPEHKCVCGRTDPGLVYVTATFMTGTGASAAPAAQTVIKDEGRITRPADPTRVGWLFGGWYAEGAGSAFDFTQPLAADVRLTAKWNECTDHNFVNGICTRCGLKDPKATAHCSGEKAVSLMAGRLIFTLGGTELGEYTFAKSGSGWSIRTGSGKYLGFAGNAFTYADTPFAWSYSGGRFTTSVTTSGGSGGIFGWLFGGSRTTTTTYYLVYTGGKFAVSTGTGGADASFKLHVESDAHSGTWKTVGKTHTRTCTVCGETESAACTYGGDHKCTVCGGYDPDYVKIDVSVSLSQRTSGGNSGILGWLFGGGRKTTTYVATIETAATGTTVTKVEYSTNGGASWTSGNTVTSDSQIGPFLIRVTDGSGTVHNYRYNGTVVIAQ